MAEWSQPVPPNGVITAYTVTCTLSTIQVCYNPCVSLEKHWCVAKIIAESLLAGVLVEQ